MSRKTRKLMWSVPLVAAFAVVGALAIFAALAPNLTQAHDVPGAPEGLAVEPADGSDGRSALVLTWRAPADGGAESYRIDTSTDGAKWKYHMTVTEMTYTHTGLDHSTRMYYRVFGVNSAGVGQVSRDVSGTTNGLSEPAKVGLASASPKGPTQINLSWTTPDDGGASITKYCISIHQQGRTGVDATDISDTNCNEASATSSDDVMTRTTAGTGIIVINAKDSDGVPVTGYEHKGLRAKQEWSYMVWAVNSVGRSKLMSDQRKAKAANAMRPDAPTNLTLIQVTDGSTIQLFWNGPVSDGGQDIVGFRVEVSDTSGQWPAPPATPTVSTDFADLKLNVTGLGAIAGTSAMGLAINLPPIDSASTSDLQRQLQHSHADLAGETLRYRVRTETGTAAADRMTSLWSETATITTKAIGSVNRITDTAVAATAAADNKTGQIKLTISGTMRQDVGEDAPDEFTPTGYRVDVSEDSGETWQTEERYTRRIDGNEYEQLNLKPGDMLTFRVFPWDGSDLGIPSTVVTGTAGPVKVPGAVGDLDATVPALPAGAGQIDLGWTIPSSDGGGKITRYCISANRITAEGTDVAAATALDSDPTSNSVNCTSSRNPTNAAGLKAIREANTGIIVIAAMDADGDPVTGYEHKGLTTGHRWKYTVYAVNSAGPGAASDTVDDMTGKAAKPGAPKHLSAESARDSNLARPGDRGIVLLWTSADNPPGAPVTGYRVQLKKDDGVFETVHTTNSYTHWVDRSEPKDGETRTYRVVAVNSVGYDTNVYAEIMFKVTGTGDDQMIMYLPEHSHNMAPTTVGMIDDMTLTAGAAASTMDVMGYFTDADGDTLTYSATSSDPAVATAMIAEGTSMLTVDPMAAGTATVTVTANDGNGGMVSQMFDVTVSMELMAPTNVRVNPVGSGLVNVGWDMVAGAAGYTIIAVNIADPTEAPTETINNPDAIAGQIGNLTVGEEYNIYVASFGTALDFAMDFSEKKRVTVE